MKKGKVIVVSGGQYGSEGKGRVAAKVVLENNCKYAVRCGGTNAGHSLTFSDGKILSARQLSMSGVVSDTVKLVLPAGALINPEILKAEMLRFNIPAERIIIDRNAMIIEQQDIDLEAGAEMFNKISSTQSGVGAASARRIMRKDVRLAKDILVAGIPWTSMLADTAKLLNDAVDAGESIMIEGTQGFGLSLYHSPFYPCTTSRDTGTAAFVSECGLSPLLVTDVILVMRAFPIRVSGQQAGPIKDEMTWAQVTAESGSPNDLTEMTQVTKKMRRVGRFDFEMAKYACMINRPTELAIVALDYLDYKNRGKKNYYQLTLPTQLFLQRVQNATGVRVGFMGTGPEFTQLNRIPRKYGPYNVHTTTTKKNVGTLVNTAK
jgi:adenylosuccinate synthase